MNNITVPIDFLSKYNLSGYELICYCWLCSISAKENKTTIEPDWKLFARMAVIAFPNIYKVIAGLIKKGLIERDKSGYYKYSLIKINNEKDIEKFLE